MSGLAAPRCTKNRARSSLYKAIGGAAMTISRAERRIRAVLPVVKLLQVIVPLRVARWSERRSAAHVRPPEGVEHGAVSADGVRCEWFIPEGSPNDTALLYLHGGGFIFGVSDLHRAMLARLAQAMGVRALMVDYRLAPEHPYPAALEDCVTAYRWLLAQGTDAMNVVIAGDSAGGNLTITTLMRLRDAGDALPAAATCLSPVTDLTGAGTFQLDFRDPLLHPKAAATYRSAYVANGDSRNPLISPVLGDWRGLPPLLIHAGEDEILRNDAERAAQLAREAGVDVQLEIYPRMWHVWQLYPSLPQARQSLDAIARFLRAHMPAPENG
jgi:acetyl esterase/lipase